MNLVDIVDTAAKTLKAEYVFYGLVAFVAALGGKKAYEREGAKRKCLLENDLKALQTERFDELKDLVEDARDRIARAEIIIKQLEGENGVLKSKLYVSSMRVEQLERTLVRHGHAIPSPLHLNQQ